MCKHPPSCFLPVVHDHQIVREVGSRMAGQPFMAVSSNGEPAAKELIEDEVADIGGTPDVMNKIMDWSDS